MIRLQKLSIANKRKLSVLRNKQVKHISIQNFRSQGKNQVMFGTKCISLITEFFSSHVISSVFSLPFENSFL